MTGLYIVLFILYTTLFCFFIIKAKAFRHPVISRGIFIACFLLKVLAGLIYGYIYSRQPYVTTSDAWQIFHGSLVEYNLFLHDPAGFFKTIFVFEGNTSFSNFSPTESSYWNVLKEVILIKFEGLLNLFSFGNYYVNMVIFNALIFLGSNAYLKRL